MTLFLFSQGTRATAAEETINWNLSSYQVQVFIAADAVNASPELVEYLQDRIDNVVGSMWSQQTELLKGPLKYQLLRGDSAPTHEDLTTDQKITDKLFWITIRSVLKGTEITVQEYDVHLRYAGPKAVRVLGQQELVAEFIFRTMLERFSPVAHFRKDKENPASINLSFKGSELPSRDHKWKAIKPADIYLPFYRRTKREGGLIENGLQVVPWTLFELNKGFKTAIVHASSKRPFAGRRRGRVEQLAIATRSTGASLRLQLRSRLHTEKPLVGYEIMAQNIGEKDTHSLGITDLQGELLVPHGKSPVQMLYIRSGTEVVAKIPVIPGAYADLIVPLPDDEVRLVAEADIRALQEELIDVVARRAIYSIQAKKYIAAKNFERADQMLVKFNKLPTRAIFGQRVRRIENVTQSDDKKVQRRLDRLFSGTKGVLDRFLDASEASKLQSELRLAKQTNTN